VEEDAAKLKELEGTLKSMKANKASGGSGEGESAE